MKKKAIFTISNEGSVGKTFSASLILEELRIRRGLSVGAYLCDLTPTHNVFQTRYGQRDEDGDLIENQNPLIGVKSLDMFCRFRPSDITEHKYKLQMNEAFIAALADEDSEVVIMDIQASNLEDLYAQIFDSLDEFLDTIEAFDREVFFVMPLKGEKTIDSMRRIVLATEGRDVNFIVVVNSGLITDLSIADWRNNTTYLEMVRRGKYFEFELPNLTKKPQVFQDTQRAPFSSFMEEGTNNPKRNDHIKNFVMLNLGLTTLFKGYKHINGQTCSVFDDIKKILP